MGTTQSTIVEPEGLAEFKQIPSDSLLDDIEIPEREENRQPTDRTFLIVFIVCFVILIPFMIYTMVNSDVDRYGGYDTCGNICGKKNEIYSQVECSGKDFTNEKYLEYDGLTSTRCVKECRKEDVRLGTKCFNQQFVPGGMRENTSQAYEIGTYLNSVAGLLVFCCFMALGITLVMLFLFRYATAAVVWGILIGVNIFAAIVLGYLWHWYTIADEANRQGLLLYNCFLTVIWIILLCVLIALNKKIELVIVLLKEVTKAISALPLLFWIPILTFFVEVLLACIFIYAMFIMFSAGTLTSFNDSHQYEPNGVMLFTLIFSFWMFFWISQFLIGVQYMIIAGAISKWYFTKNKALLYDPILSSIRIVFKYHLGSVAIGSLVITIIAIIRAILTSLTKNRGLRICFDFLTEPLKFLTKNAYILTALHGKPFCKSGKRAVKIILKNSVNILSINFIGDFVIAMAQILIIIVTMLITYAVLSDSENENVGFAYLIVFLTSLAVAGTVFSIFGTAMDTIFLCFCEDSILNDGMARPYAMTRDLMEFVENSKKVFTQKKR